MGLPDSDVAAITQSRANLSELADQAKAGAERMITKNDARDVDPLDGYPQPELERIHLLLIAEVRRGLADIEAGRTVAADVAIAQLQQRRAGSASSETVKPLKANRLSTID